MIIQSGEFQMNSTRKYSKTVTTMGAISSETSQTKNATDSTNCVVGGSGFWGNLFGTQEGVEENENDFLGTLNYKMAPSTKTTETSEVTETNRDKMLRLKFQTMHYLLELLFRRRVMESQDSDMAQQLNEVFGGSSSSGSSFQMFSYSSYEESETTTFHTDGTVKTSDGREISFGVDVGMSQSFYQENMQYFSSGAYDLCDPLVINMDVGSAEVSDQKFYFDLDCDGTKENISMLGAGSGFLALDKNGDGEINDGSELFGTSSGDGFYDLSQYDTDGNGWIDEADEIFDKLRIWCMDENGNSQLYTLKQKDVGAICLYNVNTQFSMKDMDNNTNGVIRETGFYLTESGRASTIQHVDLAM